MNTETKNMLRKFVTIPFIFTHPDLMDASIREKLFKDLNITTWAPQHKTQGSACVDFRAAATVKIPPMRVRSISTGIACQLPHGFELSARPRSGLFINHNIIIVGTIDDDFRGEIKILLANFGDEEFQINFGDRIAQFKLSRYCNQHWTLVDELTITERGKNGLGHTGLK